MKHKGPRKEQWQPLIKAAIERQYKEAVQAGQPYKLNQALIAREIGMSRPTLAKHMDYIDDLLSKLASDRRRVDGQATVEFMKDQNGALKAQILDLEHQKTVLMQALQAVFDRVYAASLTAGDLMEADLRKHARASEVCPLCGSNAASIPDKPSNVVDLRGKPK